jgi:YHS domain-containing protein
VIGWLLKLLLLLVLVRCLMLLIGGFLRGLLAVPQAAGPGPRSATREPHSRGRLVQDPVCGTYVLQERALTLRTGAGSTAFFCSERCRSAYDAQAARPR